MAMNMPNINLYSQQSLLNNRDREMIKLNPQTDYANDIIDMQLYMPSESFSTFHKSHFYEPISMKETASDFTYDHFPVQKKRFREYSTNDDESKLLSQSDFVDKHFLYQFQIQQQSEINRLIAQNTEKLMIALEEETLKRSRIIQETAYKKLKEKEEEIQKLRKVNFMLQERVKSLIMENQLWKEMAMTNETAVNTLRNELEQVLAHVSENQKNQRNFDDVDDAVSICLSNNYVDEDDENNDEEDEETSVMRRMCNKCGVKESVVVLLPCRHLCLCTMCESTSLLNCPLCFSSINASVTVNFS